MIEKFVASSRFAGLAFAGLVLTLTSCAPRATTSGPQRPSVQRAAVPFFGDDGDQNGLSSLASILTFWGYPTTPENLRKEFAYDKLDGSRIEDLAKAAGVRGLQATVETGNADVLRAELLNRRPVLLLLNLGYRTLPRRHYVVVTGYDDIRDGFYMHSKVPNRFVSRDWLLSHWQDADNRWVHILPPSPSH